MDKVAGVTVKSWRPPDTGVHLPHMGWCQVGSVGRNRDNRDATCYQFFFFEVFLFFPIG